jgi:hypothetical protein
MKRLGIAAMLALSLAGCADLSSLEHALPLAPTPAPVTLPPLALITRLQLPASVRNVQEAAEYLLEPSGYHLVTGCRHCPPESGEIARKPISPLGLHPQLTTIERALLLVSGSGTRLVVDDDARQVSLAYASPTS